MKILLLWCVAFPLTTAGFIYVGTQLSKRFPGDLRVLSFFFSLSVVVTTVVMVWASSRGYLDARGKYIGTTGQYIGTMLGFFTDIQAEIELLIASAILVLMPQFLCYLLCGLFGVAAIPRFVTVMVQFVIWSLAKWYATIAGIVISISTYGLMVGWGTISQMAASIAIWFSTFAFASAVFMIAIYRDVWLTDDDVAPLAKRVLGHRLLALHVWFTRRNALSEDVELKRNIERLQANIEILLVRWVQYGSGISPQEAIALKNLHSTLSRSADNTWDWLVSESQAFQAVADDLIGGASAEFVAQTEAWAHIMVSSYLRKNDRR